MHGLVKEIRYSILGLIMPRIGLKANPLNSSQPGGSNVLDNPFTDVDAKPYEDE